MAASCGCALVTIAAAQPCIEFAVEPGDYLETCRNTPVYLQATIEPGVGPTSYQWFRNGLPVADGPRPSGAVIEGSNSFRMVITGTTADEWGRYSLRVTRECGEAWSREAVVDNRLVTVGSIELSPPGPAYCTGQMVTATMRLVDGSVTQWTFTPAIGEGRQRRLIDQFECANVWIESEPYVVYTPEGWIPGVPGEFVDKVGGSDWNLGLRVDGTVAAWRFGWPGIAPDSPVGTFRQIAANQFGQFIMIRQDGTLASYRHDPESAIGNLPEGRFVSVACAVRDGYFNLAAAVREDGQLIEWGTYPPDQWQSMWTSRPWGLFESVHSARDRNADRVSFVAKRRDGAYLEWGGRPLALWMPPEPMAIVLDVRNRTGLRASGVLRSSFGVSSVNGIWPRSPDDYTMSWMWPEFGNGEIRGVRVHDARWIVVNSTSTSDSFSTTTLRRPGIYAGAIIRAPRDAHVTVNRSALLDAGATRVGITYRWSRDGIDLVDGRTANGSFVSGASTAALMIGEVRAADAGTYTLTATSPCETRTASAAVTVRCAPDLNADGEINADDFAAFLECYFAGNPCEEAEFTDDSVLDADDLAEFIGAYFAGCDG